MPHRCPGCLRRAIDLASRQVTAFCLEAIQKFLALLWSGFLRDIRARSCLAGGEPDIFQKIARCLHPVLGCRHAGYTMRRSYPLLPKEDPPCISHTGSILPGCPRSSRAGYAARLAASPRRGTRLPSCFSALILTLLAHSCGRSTLLAPVVGPPTTRSVSCGLSGACCSSPTQVSRRGPTTCVPIRASRRSR